LMEEKIDGREEQGYISFCKLEQLRGCPEPAKAPN
jgi:hypothetical protein